MLLTISGWLYLLRRKRVFGIIHAALMFSIGGLGLYFGLPPLSKSSSYHGEWMMGLLCLGLVIVGIVALICGIGMVWHLLTMGSQKINLGKELRSMFLMGLGSLILAAAIVCIIIWCAPHAPKGVPVYQGP
jgi:heme/copper-type cytochrome/quinol oxidase subunit 1